MKSLFRPAQRLHKPQEFAQVFSKRRVFRGAFFDLLRGQAAGNPASASGIVPTVRLGLVVPKRLAKRAVLRNAIKRQAREAFRLQAARLPPADLVLKLARWPANVERRLGQRGDVRQTLRQEIERLLRQCAHVPEGGSKEC